MATSNLPRSKFTPSFMQWIGSTDNSGESNLKTFSLPTYLTESGLYLMVTYACIVCVQRTIGNEYKIHWTLKNNIATDPVINSNNTMSIYTGSWFGTVDIYCIKKQI